MIRALVPIALLLALAAPARAAIAPDRLSGPAGADSSGARRPRWALVLSGGAARGLAHLGVLKVLEEEGLTPDVVVGSSMGAVIGALYASGLTPEEIQARLERVGWSAVFDPRAGSYEWRGITMPRPWLLLVASGRGLRLPSALLDESALDHRLVLEMLGADAAAQGDFDRLPVPLRAVATDVATLSPVVLRSGSVARAVRTSSSIPLLFPPVPYGDRLLVDGGTASNLPVGTARAEGVDHILAVDVALVPPVLDEHSSALTIAYTLIDRVNKRGQTDTLTAADRLVWLHLPGIAGADFALADSLVAAGAREARPAVLEAARAWHLARTAPPRAAPDTLPPLAAPPRWVDRFGAPARRAAAAGALFGRAPAGPLPLAAVAAGLERVYRGDLFESAWPTFATTHDSTAITVEVHEHERAQLALAFGYDSDRQARGNLALAARPVDPRLPALMLVGVTVRRYGWQVYGSAEPHALHRGGDGTFLRGGVRRTETRLFDRDGAFDLARTTRLEALFGSQVALPTGDLVQVGAGAGSARSAGRTQSGAIGAARLDGGVAVARHVEALGMGGPDGYGTLAASLACSVPLGPLVIRPALAGGWVSVRTPPDELTGVGGPESFAGLRHDEWLGRRSAAFELRAIRALSNALEVHAFGQAARVREAASRTDLGDRLHFAGGLGLRLNVPFGPLALDWGLAEQGAQRLDVALGQDF